MTSVTSAALATITIATGAILLSTTDVIKIVAPDDGVRLSAPAVVAITDGPGFDGPQREPTTPPSLREINESARASIAPRATPTIDARSPQWPANLYPELVRIETLERKDAHTALAELAPMLSSDDPVIRLAAIEALGDMTLKDALPALMAALNDPSPQLRVAALEALAVHDDQSTASSIESLLYDPDPEVRVAAIDALSDLESEVSVHALAALMSDQSASIRHHAVYALGDIGGKTAMIYLLQARYDPVATIRTSAAAIIAELTYEAAY